MIVSDGGGMIASEEPVLRVRDLSVEMEKGGRHVSIVQDIDFDIHAGERVAIVGESGSGKSVTARAILQLDRGAKLAGSVRFNGEELIGCSERRMRTYRGSQMSMVFQDPLRSLNPLQTIGDQIAEPLRIRGVGKREATLEAEELLDSLGVDNARERMRAYPFEFSGGMRQRVALAIALVAKPKLLIADEPTTALDTRVQERVLKLIDDVARARGLAVLLITHDLGVVAGFADRVAVMYAGRIVETAPVDEIYEAPSHPYTTGLLAAVPRVDIEQSRLLSMPGSPVTPTNRPGGCPFHPRCPRRMEACETVFPTNRVRPDGKGIVACHLYASEESA